MKILMDITFNKARHNGITTYSHEIISRIKSNASGNEIELAAILYPNQRNEQTYEYFYSLYKDKNIKFLKKSYFYGFISKVKSFLNRWVSVIPHRYFKNNDADIMCFFYNYIPKGVANNKKIVVVVHDLANIKKDGKINNAVYRQYKYTVFRADLIITDSEYSKKEIINYFPEVKDKIKVIYCGVDTLPYKTTVSDEIFTKVKTKYNLNKNYIFYIGRTTPNKNLPNLIKAYNILPEQVKSQYDLVLANSNTELNSLINELKLSGSVKCLNGFDEEDKAALLKMSSVLCLVSKVEGFGLPIIEAMAAGTPVVTSNVSCLPEVAGDAARLVDPYDINSIAEGIQDVLANENLRAELIEKGYKRADCFSWDNAAKSFADELHSL